LLKIDFVQIKNQEVYYIKALLCCSFQVFSVVLKAMLSKQLKKPAKNWNVKFLYINGKLSIQKKVLVEKKKLI
jgi:hypothetical protein